MQPTKPSRLMVLLPLNKGLGGNDESEVIKSEVRGGNGKQQRGSVSCGRSSCL